MKRVTIVGTGLIGASVGLALKANGFDGRILGWDPNPAELGVALERGAIDEALSKPDDVLHSQADIYVLCAPVLPILDWMQRLSGVLSEGTLVTDVGSTKREIATMGAELFGGPGRAQFLPGHPMAGKELGGAALAEAELFRGAAWLFCGAQTVGLAHEWRIWVSRFGASVREMEPERHDEICAWVSHLPQFLSTALAALLEDTFADDPEAMAAVRAIGGRALRETTRLGSSPYSMWRDIAMTNTSQVANSLHALEQRLAHLRENLRTPELREEFAIANRFRERSSQ